MAVVAAVLMQSQALRKLERELFVIRREHFGDQNARCLGRELKGKDLLSRNSFKMAEKYGTSRNHEMVRGVFDACIRLRGRYPIHVFGAVAYGARDLLTAASGPRLDKPLAHVLDRVSEAACRINRRDRVNLVFDEQIGTRADVAIRTKQFVAGVKLPNVSHFPLSAVSHTSPGIQLADIAAFILGRRAVNDPAFAYWISRVRSLEWQGRVDGKLRGGIGIFSRTNGKIVREKSWLSEAKKQ